MYEAFEASLSTPFEAPFGSFLGAPSGNSGAWEAPFCSHWWRFSVFLEEVLPLLVERLLEVLLHYAVLCCM